MTISTRRLSQKGYERIYEPFKLHANHTPEMPEEALARSNFKAFLDRRDSEIWDLPETVDRLPRQGSKSEYGDAKTGLAGG
jgi:hypothetical protein